MKLSQSRRGFLAVVMAGACLLPSVSNAATTVVGSGPDKSYLVIESPNLGVRTYEVHYTYGFAPYDAKFLLDQAVAGDPTLTATYGQFGTIGTPPVPNYYVNSINSESGDFIPPSTYIYWAQWLEGGTGFQNADSSFNPGAPLVGVWTFSYGISTHTIAPGSSYALFYSDGGVPPSIAPIPEPSAVISAIIGSLVILVRRRRA